VGARLNSSFAGWIKGGRDWMMMLRWEERGEEATKEGSDAGDV